MSSSLPVQGNNASDPNNANVGGDDLSEAVDSLTKNLGEVALQDGTQVGEVTLQDGTQDDALRQFASWVSEGLVKNILVVVGAGISVAAGIPDFRSPGTGLYDNLQKYNLPFPEAVFDVRFYHDNPQPFITLASELWPTGDQFHPTISHCFLTLLARKNLLRRVYSQNIDGLEHLAKLPAEKLIECHGNFRSASCIECKAPADADEVKNTILNGEVPFCKKCQDGKVKPDIVFFGESLPSQFSKTLPNDLQAADCCIVMGTSLKVAPVSLIPDMMDANCKRLLINREPVGSFLHSSTTKGLMALGDCDATVEKLVQILGWQDELNELYAQVSLRNIDTRENSNNTRKDTSTEDGASAECDDSMAVAMRYQAIENLTTIFGFPEAVAEEAVAAVGVDVTTCYNYILDNNLANDSGGPVVPIDNCPHLAHHVKINENTLSQVFGNHRPQQATCSHRATSATDGSGSAGLKEDIEEDGSCPSKENWLCLECGVIRCSRYQNGHGLTHWEETKSNNTNQSGNDDGAGHCLAVSLSDLSVWCHVCASYARHPTIIAPIVSRLEHLKFD